MKKVVVVVAAKLQTANVPSRQRKLSTLADTKSSVMHDSYKECETPRFGSIALAEREASFITSQIWKQLSLISQTG